MPLSKAVSIIVTDVSQTQKVMDLATGNEDAQITVAQKRYFAPEYDAKEYGGTPEEFSQAVLEAASELVTPQAKQIQALLNYATSQSYQEGKAAALATGNFLTQDLKARIVQVMRGNQAFVDDSASDCFKKWKVAFAEKKAGAIKILDIAKTIGDFDLS